MATTLAPGKVIVSSVIEEAGRDELLRLARAADRSLSAELRRAVSRYLDERTDHKEEAAHAVSRP
ncbi:MAG TPA: hypothetical protein VFK56_18845, partial [Mycobacterium sp.]|jgi:hypothetical protein|nr:hypothetical protein [Mycobacterium sp.]